MQAAGYGRRGNAEEASHLLFLQAQLQQAYQLHVVSLQDILPCTQGIPESGI